MSDHKASAFIEAEFRQLAVDASHPLAATEVWGPNSGGKVEVFLNGEVLVERVVLGDVGDVFPKWFVVFVEGTVIEKHFALSWGKLTRERSQEGAFSAPTCAHHANHFTAFHGEGNAIHRHGSVTETTNQIAHIQCANHILFLFNEAFGKVAPQALSDIHSDHVAIGELGGISHGGVANEDGAIRLQNFKLTGLFVVVAGDFQEDVAARARREKNIVFLQQSGVVGDKILAL